MYVHTSSYNINICNYTEISSKNHKIIQKDLQGYHTTILDFTQRIEFLPFYQSFLLSKLARTRFSTTFILLDYFASMCHWIHRIIEMTVEMYKNPKGMVGEISALGLRPILSRLGRIDHQCEVWTERFKRSHGFEYLQAESVGRLQECTWYENP